jgi:hypothetical protein
MRVRQSPFRPTSRSIWQVCLCALLIGLVLYNPFLLLTNQSDGLAYHSLARHRATVGASEMQHFSPVQSESVQPEIIVETAVIEVVAPKNDYPLPIVEEEILLRQPELVANIWFRPPPSL